MTPSRCRWHPGERVLAAGALPARSAEFGTGRTLPRSALHRLGLPPVLVLRDAHGGPVWPAGVVGSLTHCAGYRAAAVARAAAVPVFGVDAEPTRPLPKEVLTVVAPPEELGRLRRLAAGDPGTRGDRLLFCAKEAGLRSVVPTNREVIALADVRVDIRQHGTLGGRRPPARP